MTYTVSMENTRNGNPKKVTIQASDRFEAEAMAEMKYRGFAATDSKIVLAAGEQPADLFLIMRVSPERRLTGSVHSEAVAMLTVAGLDVAFAPLGYTYGYERNPAYAD